MTSRDQICPEERAHTRSGTALEHHRPESHLLYFVACDLRQVLYLLVSIETGDQGKVPLETQRGSQPTPLSCRPQGPKLREGLEHRGGGGGHARTGWEGGRSQGSGLFSSLHATGARQALSWSRLESRVLTNPGQS